jgi:hypothetical protein
MFSGRKTVLMDKVLGLSARLREGVKDGNVLVG